MKMIQRDLSWYLLNNCISLPAAKSLGEEVNELVRKVNAKSAEICNGLGIPESIMMAPIYNGYQKYYSVDKTNGEHYNRKRPKF